MKVSPVAPSGRDGLYQPYSNLTRISVISSWLLKDSVYVSLLRIPIAILSRLPPNLKGLANKMVGISKTHWSNLRRTETTLSLKRFNPNATASGPTRRFEFKRFYVTLCYTVKNEALVAQSLAQSLLLDKRGVSAHVTRNVVSHLEKCLTSFPFETVPFSTWLRLQPCNVVFYTLSCYLFLITTATSLGRSY